LTTCYAAGLRISEAVLRMHGQCIWSKCGRNIRLFSYGAVRSVTEAASAVSSGHAQALDRHAQSQHPLTAVRR
jgi:hypothetical protein